jgi:hypothetical protein
MDVEKNHVHLGGRKKIDGRFRVRGSANYINPPGRPEQLGETIKGQRLVINQICAHFIHRY